MGVIAESPGFKGAETRVLVDSIVGFQALVGSGHVSLLKVSLGRGVGGRRSGHTVQSRQSRQNRIPVIENKVSQVETAPY